MHRGPAPARDDLEPIFQAARLWRLEQARGGRLLTVFAPHLGGRIHGQAWIAEQGSSVPARVELWMNPPEAGFGERLPALDYPLDELLFGQLLGCGAGVIVHATAVRVGGRGLLFPGTSGAGKSTLSRVLIEAAGARPRGSDLAALEVLSDDRNVLRLIDGEPWIFGTPWHGDVDQVAAGGAPLDRILFLEHGASNRVHPLARLEAVATLMARCFPPYWDPDQLAAAADLVEKVVEARPPERFEFVPDARVVAALGLEAEQGAAR